MKALLPAPEPRQRPERAERLQQAPHEDGAAAAQPNAQGNHRGRREDRDDQARPREQRPRRDERPRDDARPARRPSRRDKETAAGLKSAVRGSKGGQPQRFATKNADSSGPLNTQLADQLSALR